ncbi:hypothetical protein ACFC8N_42795 [Streptomyces sp. NPDC055966]|uniref:hypothetical protein n=1 Tax=Streptomyces sp. NPDC055966 TaxID=3345669 RepID=UPI0035DF3043
MSAYDDLVNDIRFWDQIQGDAKRTVICEPHRAAEVRALIDQRGYDHVTVLASLACPEGQFLVIDEQALEAANRQMMQQATRDFRLQTPPHDDGPA